MLVAFERRGMNSTFQPQMWVTNLDQARHRSVRSLPLTMLSSFGGLVQSLGEANDEENKNMNMNTTI